MDPSGDTSQKRPDNPPGPPRTLGRERIRQLDREAIEAFGIPGAVLMENAGRGVADTLQDLGILGPVRIACGRGNNAGDGFVVARHLDLRGFQVELLVVAPAEKLTGDAALNYQIARRSGLRMQIVEAATGEDQLRSMVSGADWLVDGLLGTGAQGVPRSPMDRLIRAMNSQPARRLAIDLPSGLDCDTGQWADPTFRADHTCTFVAAKPGHLRSSAASLVGRLHVLDIGAPRVLVDRYLAAYGAEGVDPE